MIKRFKRKNYKSCNIIILSSKELLLKTTFTEVIFFVDNIFTFYSSSKKIHLLLVLKTSYKTFLKRFKKVLLGIFGGWFIKINLIGRGYTAFSTTRYLKLNLGYSHAIGFLIPNNLYVFCEKTKKNNLIIFSYNFLDLLNFSFFFKKLKKIDLYKGKGIKFDKEIFLLKAGKKSQY